MWLRQVSIHAPREGERLDWCVHEHPHKLFQSTLPARGSDRNMQYGFQKALLHIVQAIIALFH